MDARAVTRRWLLRHGSLSLGAIALHQLFGDKASARTAASGDDAAAREFVDRPLRPRAPPLPARAKQVIYIHLSGGSTQ